MSFVSTVSSCVWSSVTLSDFELCLSKFSVAVTQPRFIFPFLAKYMTDNQTQLSMLNTPKMNVVSASTTSNILFNNIIPHRYMALGRIFSYFVILGKNMKLI